MDNSLFQYNFRVSKASFEIICAKVKGMAKQDTNMRRCIPLEKRVGIALYALGSSAEYRTVANLFGVGRTTVGEIVVEFCKAVCENFVDHISSYPPTPAEIERIVNGFEAMGFPQCYGAVDGCHIEIQPGNEDATEYFNFKGWYSTILFAACDYNSKFTYLNIGSAGKCNDSYIFEQSSLKKCHEHCQMFAQTCKSLSNTNVPVLLIGDSAFRLSRYLMKPFPFNVSQAMKEKTFNYNLSKCRRTIENAFGQLKSRFRKIGRGLEVALHNCNVVIKACCLLHNFLKDQQENLPLIWLEEAQAQAQRIQPITTTTVGDDNVDWKTIRNAIAESFLETVED